MTKFFTLLSAFLLISNLFAQNPDDRQSNVMILGSHHMHNPGADVVNVEADDVLAPKRQKELKAVVQMLKEFQPTMIALEDKRFTKQDSLTQLHYQQYLKDSFELTRWEGHQIGFRLAKELGHSRIYNIDEPGNFPFGKMAKYAEENEQMAWINYTMEKLQSKIKGEEDDMDEVTISAMLYETNTPENLAKSHSIYVDGSRIGKGKDFPGANLLEEWYKRNIRIFSNLYKITADKKEERILVIFGAGHAPILRDLVKSSTDFELVEPNDYLKKE